MEVLHNNDKKISNSENSNQFAWVIVIVVAEFNFLNHLKQRS